MTECPVCCQRFNDAPTGQDYRYRSWKHSKSKRHKRALSRDTVVSTTKQRGPIMPHAEGRHSIIDIESDSAYERVLASEAFPGGFEDKDPKDVLDALLDLAYDYCPGADSVTFDFHGELVAEGMAVRPGYRFSAVFGDGCRVSACNIPKRAIAPRDLAAMDLG